jgi:hypothetical protein
MSARIIEFPRRAECRRPSSIKVERDLIKKDGKLDTSEMVAKTVCLALSMPPPTLQHLRREQFLLECD